MRLRHVKNAFEDLANDTKYFVLNPKDYHGKWASDVFKNNNPIHIEIGCGKGQFMMGLAKHFPDINFIAIEKYDSVLVRCLEKVSQDDIPNLKLVLLDALMLKEVFDKGEVEEIYLNFSDPWPKTRHAKRRLTSDTFLKKYDKIFKGKKRIIQKTDNIGLFAYSITSLSTYGYTIDDVTLDLKNEGDYNNVETEYEKKFDSLGIKICRLKAHKDD